MLNKDLFGKIPVSVERYSEPPPVQKLQRPEGQEVFHGSIIEHPEQFMKAPVLHVGSAEQAANLIYPGWEREMDDEDFPLYEDVSDVPNVHPLYISKHAKIHPITVPDDIANEAHYHFLTEKGHVPTSSVANSRSFHGVDHPLVKTALNALRQNKIVPYFNTWETPDGEYENERHIINASKSYMVPSPALNLLQFGEKEKASQTMLPLDYTTVLPESNRTRKTREIKKKYPWAGDSGIRDGRFDS